MFIHNNKKIISQKIKAKNIAPLMERIEFLREQDLDCKIEIKDIIKIDSIQDSTNLDSTIESIKLHSMNLNTDFTIKQDYAISNKAQNSTLKDSVKRNPITQVSKESAIKNLATQDSTITQTLHKQNKQIKSSLYFEIKNLLLDLKPWRKGPFEIFSNLVKSEWNSSIKFNILKNHLNIKDKVVADIGCNNGYYMFRMLPFAPKEIIGFEPSAFYKCQFDFLNSFIKSEIKFELLGLEDLEIYDKKFDFITCLGVLYHRTNPIDCLKILKNSLHKNGEIIIDSLFIDSDDDIVLSPLSYAKMKNVYFIPSIKALKNWLNRANFKNIEIIGIKKTDFSEQRQTEWINGESLNDFLNPNDINKTIEGYPAPQRVYIKAS